ncbi:MAG: DUF4093 domain-containing protein [Clostridia bacterium]|nr:DUF4093 domain-containing protein [Clostridia bacterium]
MIKIKEAIIVEGKYDKIKLSGIVDGIIISVNGFNIFTDVGMQKTIRKLAEKTGIIVLTDSDRAGFLIRNFICGITDCSNVKHAYIPQIEGVEKRKDTPSKDGFLGVEGINDEVIKQAVKKAATEKKDKTVYITKADFFALGLAGRPDSKAKRDEILKIMELPTGISANSLIEILNSTCNLDEINDIINKIL